MATFYSLDKFERSVDLNNLYDIYKNTIVYDTSDIPYIEHTVTRDEEARIDLICKNVYSGDDYQEEVLKFNGIINSWSIKEGDTINLFLPQAISTMHSRVTAESIKNLPKLVDPNKNNASAIPPSIRPPGLQQISLNEKNKEIKIINSFE